MAPSARITSIAKRLEEQIGDVSSPPREPLTLLVETILSQNTNDTNRDRAFASLMARFGDFETVAAAPPDEIANAIRDGGLHHQKAHAIKEALARIAQAAGSLDLGFLADRSLDEAMAFLLALPGVGPKTAGIVVLFAFDMPYFPVDTHIRRVTRRLGLVSDREDPHARLNAILPRDAVLMKRLHLQLIGLGRRVCHPRRPECGRCPLRSDCPSSEGRDGLRRTERAAKMRKGERV